MTTRRVRRDRPPRTDANCHRPRLTTVRVTPLDATTEERNALTNRQMRAVADATRLQILALLATARTGMAVTEVVTELGSITQPTVSLHLRELVNVGLVRWRQVGSYHVHLVNRRAFTSLALRIQSLGSVQ